MLLFLALLLEPMTFVELPIMPVLMMIEDTVPMLLLLEQILLLQVVFAEVSRMSARMATMLSYDDYVSNSCRKPAFSPFSYRSRNDQLHQVHDEEKRGS